MLGRHAVEIGIGVGVVEVEGIEPHVDLPAVGHAVAVRVPVDRIGAEVELLEVGEAVEVGVEVLDAGARGSADHRIEQIEQRRLVVEAVHRLEVDGEIEPDRGGGRRDDRPVAGGVVDCQHRGGRQRLEFVAEGRVEDVEVVEHEPAVAVVRVDGAVVEGDGERAGDDGRGGDGAALAVGVGERDRLLGLGPAGSGLKQGNAAEVVQVEGGVVGAPVGVGGDLVQDGGPEVVLPAVVKSVLVRVVDRRIGGGVVAAQRARGGGYLHRVADPAVGAATVLLETAVLDDVDERIVGMGQVAGPAGRPGDRVFEDADVTALDDVRD